MKLCGSVGIKQRGGVGVGGGVVSSEGAQPNVKHPGNWQPSRDGNWRRADNV